MLTIILIIDLQGQSNYAWEDLKFEYEISFISFVVFSLHISCWFKYLMWIVCKCNCSSWTQIKNTYIGEKNEAHSENYGTSKRLHKFFEHNY